MKFTEPRMEINRNLKLRKGERVIFRFLGLDPNIISYHLINHELIECEGTEGCPHCITARTLFKSEEHRDIGRMLMAKKRYYFPVELLPNYCELETGPYIWSANMVNYKAFMQLLTNFEEYGFIEKDEMIPDLYYISYITDVHNFPCYDKCAFRFNDKVFTVAKLHRDESMQTIRGCYAD